MDEWHRGHASHFQDEDVVLPGQVLSLTIRGIWVTMLIPPGLFSPIQKKQETKLDGLKVPQIAKP